MADNKYVPPRLEEYGDLQTITNGGDGGGEDTINFGGSP